MTDSLIVDINKNVATIKLNRPEVHNALNPELIKELSGLMRKLEGDNSIDVIVLKGNGPSFCSGADITWFSELSELTKEETKEAVKDLPDLLLDIFNSSKITIALAHGSVLGGGIGLVSACDFIISEESCRFGFREVKLGIAPATISPFVITKMDSSKAKELMITGEFFNGKKAAQVGLVSHLAKEGDLGEALNKLLTDVAGSSPNAVRNIKKMINETRHQQLILKELEGTTGLLAELIHSDDAKRKMKAFLKNKKATVSN